MNTIPTTPLLPPHFPVQKAREGIAAWDRQAVEARLDYIDRMLGFLREQANQSQQALQEDPRSYHAALYELQSSLQAVVDIAAQVVDALGQEQPQERGDALGILAKAGIVPSSLAEALVPALSLRETLMREYVHVAPDVVYQFLQENLDDLERFCWRILDYMDRSEQAS